MRRQARSSLFVHSKLSKGGQRYIRVAEETQRPCAHLSKMPTF